MNDDIINYFPVTEKIKSPRQTQIEVLNKVDDLIQQGKHKITICAPTGSGKSGIAIALLNKYGGTYTSPLNALVDQIASDFEVKYSTTLKGRRHYRCNAKAKYGFVSCDDGYCQSNVCAFDETKQRNCDGCMEICPCSNCSYKKQKAMFKNAKISNTNFSMFQIGFTNDKPLLIIDESDDIESFIRLFHKVVIDDYVISNDFNDHILVLQELEIKLSDRIEEIDDIRNIGEFGSIDINELNKEYKRITRKHNSIKMLLDDWKENEKAWCVTYPSNNKTSYEPISVDRFFNKLIEDKITILMSATPNRIDGFEFIEVGSTFPKDIRPWKFIPVGKMSLSNRDITLPNVANFISRLEGKTVVHCNAYSVARDLNIELSSRGKLPLLQVNYETCNAMECCRDEIIQRFKDDVDEHQILLSVNLARGVDFPDEDIVNNVIVVVPWANPTDRLVKAKNKLIGTSWQHIEIANTIMQAYGRVNRNDIKKTNTYILDTNFNDANGRGVAKNWFDKHNDLFFDWFLEAENIHNPEMEICPVCGEDVNYVYHVSYQDYMGKICHDCNKEMLRKYNGD